MERSIFPRPEVVRLLEKYVEVRLHTDKANETSERLQKLKEERLQDAAMPIYEIVDPVTRQRIAEPFKGADLPSGSNFVRFLEEGLRAWKGPPPAVGDSTSR
jgi:hypothetical protein